MDSVVFEANDFRDKVSALEKDTAVVVCISDPLVYGTEQGNGSREAASPIF